MPQEKTTIDKDLYDGLQQARKKKPRYFALIAKGPDVVGLIVQKKLINAGAVQKVKTESKGSLVIEGVCNGEGVELTFEVVGEEPSILPKKIKDFIEESTELTLKAKWAVVTTLSAVMDDEAIPAAPPIPTSAKVPTPDAAVQTPAPGTKQAAIDVEALRARLKELLTRQKDLFAKDPAFRETMSPFSQPATSLVMQGSADAHAALDNLQKALEAAERAGQQSAQNEATSPANLFNERLKALLPEIKAAAGTPGGDEAKLKASEAGAFARKQDFTQATLLLDQAQAVLKGTAASKPTSQNESSAATSVRSAGGLVEKRKFLLERWRRIPEEVRANLKKLKPAIERALPDEDAEKLIGLAEEYLDDFYGEMKEAIDDDINSGDAQYKNAISTIAAFRTEIASEPLIQHLKKNTLKVEVTVESILLGALAEIEQALAS